MYIRWQRWKAPATSWWHTQRRLLQRAVRVLPNSQAEANLLQTFFRLGPAFQQRVDVVPNAIDTTLYDPLPAPSQAFLEKYGVQDFVLQVGTISPVKNQLGLIEALFDTPVPIVIVGPTPSTMVEYAAACRSRATERGNVIFIDHVPHEELPALYALATVHVLPSWRETPGLVTLEAASAGCQVVTTSIGSARDYLGDLAWYCYPGDLQSIRESVECALKAPRSPKLRERVLAHFTWHRAAEATVRSYRKALETWHD
jgi:glycosyltransferase involved in cell wall biosynthesis